MAKIANDITDLIGNTPEFFCEFDLKRVAYLLLKPLKKEANASFASQYNVTYEPPQDFAFADLRSPPFGLTLPQAV